MTDQINSTEPTLEDKAELELRERMTVLEDKHDHAVDALKYVILALAALALGYLLHAYSIYTIRKAAP